MVKRYTIKVGRKKYPRGMTKAKAKAAAKAARKTAKYFGVKSKVRVVQK